jgi:hypothetical protein
MKILDDVKTKIPMQKIADAWTMAKGKLPARMTKTYPGMSQAKFVIKRIHFLLREKSFVDLGDQEIFERKVKKEDGTSPTYIYRVDFNNPAQVKRMRNILTELIDLADEDASEAKKESISEYLDYIAMASS